MITVTREQAEPACDHAYAARLTAGIHEAECRKCGQGIPCTMGIVLQRGAAKISREATDALTAYLPAGSQVTYHGLTATYRDRVWFVVGPAPSEPWSGYTLIGHDGRQITASLESLRLGSYEARQRDHMSKVQRVINTCLAVLAKYGVTVDVAVSRNESGVISVSWMSSEVIRAENRALEESKEESGQYIGAALLLMQAVRSHTRRGAWQEVDRDAATARRLADRAKVRVPR